MQTEVKSDVEQLRERLKKAREVRGRIAQIGRDTEIDRRTLDKLGDPEHTPHATTVDKLLAYFKKIDRRAKQ